MPKKWFQEDNGNISFIRIAGMIALILGVTVCMIGTIGFVIALFQKFGDGMVQALVLTGIGGIDIVGVVISKAWQKGYEE